MSHRAHQLKSYAAYRKRAKGRHGTHSPFVYSFIEQVLRVASQPPYYLTEIRELLLADSQQLEITDFGAGSHGKNAGQRKVSDIARSALMPLAWQDLLLRMAERYKPKSVLELGTSLGVTAVTLAKSLPQADVTTVEGSQSLARFAANLAEENGVKNLRCVHAQFDPFLQENETQFDWVLIDGNHTKEATLRYFHHFLQQVNPGSMLLFDDIYWSEGMTQAWNEIQANPNAILSLDLYRWGLVFFPENTEKQHFVIKSGISPLSK